MRRRWALALALLVANGVLSSGCALSDLKESNRRLKESNDRLIAENNRLEQDLADAQRGVRPAAIPARTEEAPPAAVAGIAPVERQKTQEDLILEGLKEEGVTVDRTTQGVRLTVQDRVFFSPGQAQLSAGGQRLLQRIGSVINSQYSGNLVRVDGHTDDTPVRKVRAIYPTNWELSTARACTVVRYLVDKANVQPRRIFPAGFAFHRPASSGSGETARRLNRRVEITILKESI